MRSDAGPRRACASHPQGSRSWPVGAGQERYLAAHVVGRSHRGRSGIGHALSGRRRPAGLWLVDADPLSLPSASGDLQHECMFASMTRPHFAAFVRGDAEAARHVVDFYGGAVACESMPPKVCSCVTPTPAKGVRDRAPGTPFKSGKETPQSIAVPATAVRGGISHAATRSIAAVLRDVIAAVQLITIEVGRHLLASGHAAEIAALVGAASRWSPSKPGRSAYQQSRRSEPACPLGRRGPASARSRAMVEVQRRSPPQGKLWRLTFGRRPTITVADPSRTGRRPV
jgi:hypothetical protein